MRAMCDVLLLEACERAECAIALVDDFATCAREAVDAEALDGEARYGGRVGDGFFERRETGGVSRSKISDKRSGITITRTCWIDEFSDGIGGDGEVAVGVEEERAVATFLDHDDARPHLA